MEVCDICNDGRLWKNPASHKRLAHGGGMKATIADVEAMPAPVAEAERPQASQRRRRRGEQVLTPMEQIPQPPGQAAGVEHTGAWAYYMRDTGATITDVLTIYPKGGIPDLADVRLRDRYSENAEYYRRRQARRGLEYVGQKLTEASMKRLVEIMASNREDEELFLREEIADAKDVAISSDLPDVRNQAKRRINQLERRLEMLLAPFDPDALLTELNEIARAQQLAKVDPNVLRVMRSMIGEVNEKMEARISYFQKSSMPSDAPARFSGMGSDQGAEFEGKALVT